MFKKKIIKKNNESLHYDDDDEKGKDDKQKVGINKQIQKVKPKGVSINHLKELQEVKRDSLKSIAIEEQSGLINIQYTQSITSDKQQESLQEKYISDKIQQHFHGDIYNDQDNMITRAEDDSQDILQEILEVLYQQQCLEKIQKKYLNKQEQDQAVWVGGIMEVNLSLEEKAQKIAQMEEIKRLEYFKSIITGSVYKKKVIIPPRRNQQDQPLDEVQDKFMKDLSDLFYHRGRGIKYRSNFVQVYKHSQLQKNEDNTRLELEEDEPETQKKPQIETKNE